MAFKQKGKKDAEVADLEHHRYQYKREGFQFQGNENQHRPNSYVPYHQRDYSYQGNQAEPYSYRGNQHGPNLSRGNQRRPNTFAGHQMNLSRGNYIRQDSTRGNPMGQDFYRGNQLRQYSHRGNQHNQYSYQNISKSAEVLTLFNRTESESFYDSSCGANKSNQPMKSTMNVDGYREDSKLEDHSWSLQVYWQEIDVLANRCRNLHGKYMETVFYKMHNQKDKYKISLGHRFNNLKLQQELFDDYIKNMKYELSKLHELPASDILSKAGSIFENVKRESEIFNKAVPAYGLKRELLEKFKNNQVIIVSLDNNYFLSMAFPHFIDKEYPDYEIILCMPNAVLTESIEKCCYNLVECEIDATKPNIEDKKVARTFRFLTEKKLLEELKSPDFSKLSCVIFDIPFKRSIETSILLANLRDILQNKDNFKLILILSISSDVSQFSEYFSKSAIVSSIVTQNLSFPVEIVWKTSTSSFDDCTNEIVNTILAIHINNEPGDILAFLPTVKNAKTASVCLKKKLTEHRYRNINCILMHEKCFKEITMDVWNRKNSPKRNVVLTTSCVEKHVFPFVRYVVDSGIRKVFQFDHNKGSEISTTIFNSQAQAKLRKSFVGAFDSGICYRLYSQEDYREKMTCSESPEILTINPVDAMLELYRYRQNDVDLFDSLPTDLKASALKHLEDADILKNGELTTLGKCMIKLPFPALYSKLLLLGIKSTLGFEAVVLVSFLLAKGRVFQYSQEEEEQRKIDAVKLEFVQNESDLLTYLGIYRKCKENKYSSDWCQKNFLNLNTLHEVYVKINEMCVIVFETLGEKIVQQFNYEKDDLLKLQEIIFDCFQDNLCVFNGHYRLGYRKLSSQHTVFLHPSSSLCGKKLPQFLVFDHMLCTSKDFMVNVSSVPVSTIKTAVEMSTFLFDHSTLFEKGVVQTVIEPIGEMLIKKVLLGKKGKKLKEIEERIKRETNNDLVVVEPSVEKGCVVLYTLPDCAEKAKLIVKEILNCKIEDILNEEESRVIELKKGPNIVPVLVEWIKGAQTTSVKIQSKEIGCTDMQNNLATSNIVSEDGPENIIQHSVNLMWLRRPCVGSGCIFYSKPWDFKKACSYAGKTILVHGYEAFVQVNKFNPNALYVTGLQRQTTNMYLEDVMQKLVPGAKIESVKLKYSPSFETTENDIKDITEAITTKCSETMSGKPFSIIIPKPKDTAIAMKAYINMSCVEEIELITKELNNMKIRGENVSAIPVYRSVIKCSNEQFKALESRCKQELDALQGILKMTGKYPPEDNIFEYVPNTKNPEITSLKLLSNHAEVIVQLQKKINDLLAGEVLNCSKVKGLHKLFSHWGHVWLQSLQKTENVLIIDEYKSKVIRLYGKQRDCFHAKCNILRFLKDTENEVSQKIDLSNEKNNRMLLKAILKKYGFNLKEFVKKYQLRSAALNIQSCYLTLHGRTENIKKAETSLSDLASNVDFNLDDLLSSQEMCSVCCTTDPKLTFRLEHCGHLYCCECIKLWIEEENFPKQCCADECYKDIVLEDIGKILDNDQKKIDDLVKKSMEKYIETNSDDMVYCPAPDCPMFYFKKDMTEKKWNCPLCDNEICIPCNIVYHHGYTCETYQESMTDADYLFKVWQDANANCKQCPTCKVPIEKNEGCNHMTCILCKGHFCWLCLKAFETSREVYDHQPYCPNNQTPYSH